MLPLLEVAFEKTIKNHSRRVRKRKGDGDGRNKLKYWTVNI